MRKQLRRLRGGIRITARPLSTEKSRVVVRRLSSKDMRKWSKDVAVRLEALRRAYKATTDDRERAHILLGVLNFGAIPQWALAAWRDDLTEKLHRRKRGERKDRDRRGVITQEAVRLYRERRAADPSKSQEEAIEAVRADMGDDAPDYDTIRNAVRRSRGWRIKRRQGR